MNGKYFSAISTFCSKISFFVNFDKSDQLFVLFFCCKIFCKGFAKSWLSFHKPALHLMFHFSNVGTESNRRSYNEHFWGNSDKYILSLHACKLNEPASPVTLKETLKIIYYFTLLGRIFLLQVIKLYCVLSFSQSFSGL